MAGFGEGNAYTFPGADGAAAATVKPAAAKKNNNAKKQKGKKPPKAVDRKEAVAAMATAVAASAVVAAQEKEAAKSAEPTQFAVIVKDVMNALERARQLRKADVSENQLENAAALSFLTEQLNKVVAAGDRQHTLKAADGKDIVLAEVHDEDVSYFFDVLRMLAPPRDGHAVWYVKGESGSWSVYVGPALSLAE